jgi:hypothetical protein
MRGVFHLDISFSCGLFKALQPAIREFAPVSCYLSWKDFLLSFIIGPLRGFPSECIAVNCFYNALSRCADLGSFSITLILDVNDHKLSFCCFVSHVMGHCWLSLLSSSITISSFWDTVKGTYFYFLPAVTFFFLLILGSFEAVSRAGWAQRGPDNQR